MLDKPSRVIGNGATCTVLRSCARSVTDSGDRQLFLERSICQKNGNIELTTGVTHARTLKSRSVSSASVVPGDKVRKTASNSLVACLTLGHSALAPSMALETHPQDFSALERGRDSMVPPEPWFVTSRGSKRNDPSEYDDAGVRRSRLNPANLAS